MIKIKKRLIYYFRLMKGDFSRFFAVDANTGVVTVILPLQVSTINLTAVASIPSGQQDRTTVHFDLKK